MVTKAKQTNWLRRHWILTTVLGIFLFLIILGAIGSRVEKSSANYGSDGLVTINSNIIIPQDSEIERIWKIEDIHSINSNATGYVDGAERTINKVSGLESNRITMKVYRFDSAENANQFYEQEKQRIDVRGVEEWNLGSDCFGIKKDLITSDYAEGFCLRNNIVLYTSTVSSSYESANYGKDFMKIMINKA